MFLSSKPNVEIMNKYILRLFGNRWECFLLSRLTFHRHTCEHKTPCAHSTKSPLQKTYYFLVAAAPSYSEEMMNLLSHILQTSHPEQTLPLKTTDNMRKNSQMIFLAALLNWQESTGPKPREQGTPRVAQSTQSHQLNWTRGRAVLNARWRQIHQQVFWPAGPGCFCPQVQGTWGWAEAGGRREHIGHKVQTQPFPSDAWGSRIQILLWVLRRLPCLRGTPISTWKIRF